MYIKTKSPAMAMVASAWIALHISTDFSFRRPLSRNLSFYDKIFCKNIHFNDKVKFFSQYKVNSLFFFFFFLLADLQG